MHKKKSESLIQKGSLTRKELYRALRGWGIDPERIIGLL